MAIDIRDKDNITHEDIVRLNFIKTPCRYRFRKHFREGLRSRLMHVLDQTDVEKETLGVLHRGIRLFPLAQPLWVLRIFKERFTSPEAVQQEIQNFKIVQKYLWSSQIAASQEFIVSCATGNAFEQLLCGLQEFVAGKAINPWRPDSLQQLKTYADHQIAGANRRAAWLESAIASCAAFVENIKTMVQKAGYIPDLSGTGNMRMSVSGTLKLIDINNISRLHFDNHIRLDDKDYPVSDKSIEALCKMEEHILGRHISINDPIYGRFLEPGRMSRVRQYEKRFHETHAAAGNYPRLQSG